MKTLKRILLALLILVVLILIIGFSFYKHLAGRALPDYDRDLSLTGLYDKVEVYRDSFAVPHVFASNAHDLYMVSGYLLAQDRLWQMDMLRHVTEGRLSEIFGADYVETDLLLRSLRFRKKSDMILDQADSSTLTALTAFSEGVNLFMDQNKNRLPPEFTILRYKPEKWEPFHSLNLIGYMAWDLKAGWSEILLSTIREAVDSMRYRQILPDMLRVQPTIYPGDYSESFSTLLPDKLLNTGKLKTLGADVLEASNNWAVSGSKSSTGLPLLANDMHLGLSIPGIWYQIHQVIPGKLNVTGLLLPGAPLIICGHNDSIAWGMTNTYVDNLDFYEEKINPDDTNQYAYNGKWRTFENVKTIIKISNGEETEKTLRFTHRGPVVSSFRKIPDKVVTMHWVGDEMSDEMTALLKVNSAGNWHEFNEALRSFTSISQNIVYADKQGNIGLVCAAGIPIRDRQIRFGILPGETDQYDWKGYVPFEELPRTLNPPSGYVSSANNRTAPPDYPYHIGTWYALPSRFDRINELLATDKLLSVEDFESVQLDQHSKLAEKYMPLLLKELTTYEEAGEVEKLSVDILAGWDFNMSINSPAASIFEKWYLELMRCIYADELQGTFGSFSGTTSISRTALDQLIETKISSWLDDVSTTAMQESFHDMVVCAFSKTIANLSGEWGNDPQGWEWGKMHRLTLTHPLGAVNALNKLFDLNRGPFPVGGSFHTVSPYSYDNNKPFNASHGSSHRHIFDINDWDNSLTIIPTGISGIPSSSHYCDQTDGYVKGIYHKDYFSREKIILNAKYHMTFEPGSSNAR